MHTEWLNRDDKHIRLKLLRASERPIVAKYNLRHLEDDCSCRQRLIMYRLCDVRSHWWLTIHSLFIIKHLTTYRVYCMQSTIDCAVLRKNYFDIRENSHKYCLEFVYIYNKGIFDKISGVSIIVVYMRRL